jgi:fused signal recognition particle receptor
MFEFLRNKLKGALSAFSRKVEEEVEKPEIKEQKPEEKKEAPKREEKTIPKKEEKPPRKKEEAKKEKNKVPEPEKEPEKKSVFKKFFPFKKQAPEEKPEEKKEAAAEAPKEEPEKEKSIEEEESQRTVFGKISDAFTKRMLSKQQFEQLFWGLEVVLLENNVAVEVIDKIKSDLEEEIVGKPLSRAGIQKTIEGALKRSIESLFDVPKIDLLRKVKEKKPFVIVFLGINGSGKTTTIAKIASMLKANGITSVLAAGDTFRAAAIDQLEKHANNLGIRMIKHQYGDDSAAVAFDAVKYAEAHGIDVVLIDTAGRMHSNANLMDELKKIVRVSKPDMKIFVGEAITGNDCVEQARSFDEAVGIDGIILAKADVDEKGGAAISISYVTRKPILYLGTGQKYSDLQAFDSKKIVESIGL